MRCGGAGRGETRACCGAHRLRPSLRPQPGEIEAPPQAQRLAHKAARSAIGEQHEQQPFFAGGSMRLMVVEEVPAGGVARVVRCGRG